MSRPVRCARCGRPLRLSPGGGEPYWYHPATSTVWCSGWGDPAQAGREATPEVDRLPSHADLHDQLGQLEVALLAGGTVARWMGAAVVLHALLPHGDHHRLDWAARPATHPRNLRGA